MSRKPSDGRTYTNREAAAALGVSERTVKNWRRRGWIVNGQDGSLNVEATTALVNAGRDPTLGGQADRVAGGAKPVRTATPERPVQRTASPSAGSVGIDSDSAKLLRARALKETLAGKALRLSIEEREGKLIDRFEAEHLFVEVITEARSRLEAIPAHVASRLVGLDAREIQSILHDEVESALSGISRIPRSQSGRGCTA